MSEPNITEPFDENVKAFLRDELEKLGLHVETEYEVFHRARTIDLIAECQPEDLPKLVGTPFAYFRTRNIIELKGPNDPLHIEGFDRIMMRAWTANRLAPDQQPNASVDDAQNEENEEESSAIFVPPEERTITILCVVRPTKILDDLIDIYGFEKTDEPGVYLSKPIIPVRIIHPDELALVPKNYPLLCLSRGKKLQAFIERCLEEGLDEYLQFMLTVGLTADTAIIWNRLMEVYKLKHVVKPETWGYIEEFFTEIPEAFEVPIIQKTILENVRQAAEEAAEQARAEALEQGIEQGIEQGVQSGKIENQRSNTLHLLNRKFGDSNEEQLETIIEKIEQADDLELLTQWFDLVFEAHFLHELKLELPEAETEESDEI